MDKLVYKLGKNTTTRHSDIIRKDLMEIFSYETTPRVKEAIISSYEGNLNGVVTYRLSQARPENYQSKFVERLDDFEYIKEYEDGDTFVTPDMSNFDFSGELEILNMILEGLVGKYYEVTAKDIMKANNNKLPAGRIVIDATKAPKNRNYLLRSNDPIAKKVEATIGNKNLILYPFSNTPSIDIFEAAETYVNDNMEKWIDDTIRLSNSKLVREYNTGR